MATLWKYQQRNPDSIPSAVLPMPETGWLYSLSRKDRDSYQKQHVQHLQSLQGTPFLRFIPGPPRKYKGGWVDHVDYVDPDRFSLTVIAGLLKVGYAWWNRVIMYYLGKTRIMDSDDDIVLGGGVEYFTDSSSEEYDSADDEAYKIDPHEMEYDSEDENNDGSIGNDFVKREKYKNKRTGQAIEGMDEGHIGNGGIDEGMCKGPIKTSKDAAYDLMHKSQGLNSQ
ncbi:hypothetical protein L6164_033139 [Bauhinia variegata]|uniref:Uncharacterized protein n=1 Tax=Bauhinia variegata TaxID=167791 RepID=A0ACB9KRJ0_BAUVA|nr:hypothetical protein L6164_033139 [Bauhinia variegata]